MYIEQLKKIKINDILYSLGIISILTFFGINIIATLLGDIDTNEILKQSIENYGKNVTFLNLVLPFAILFLGLLIWVKFVLKQPLLSLTTSRLKIDWKRFWFMFFLWGGFLALVTLVNYIVYPEDFIFQFKIENFLPFLIIALIFIPLQTSFEEYFFRGYFFQYLGFKTNSKIIPLVFTSVIFGLLHLSNPEVNAMGGILMIFYIGTGFLLGMFVLMDDGLELSLGFHAANNLIGALLVTSTTSVFQTDSILIDISSQTNIYPILLQVFCVYPFLLLICAKKYKWFNWNKKLLGKLN